ncbi:hypothetical protein CTI12_AA407560 [Artemisia annua]|uniref:Cytochrome P450 n=1 Tax=Artemisia annua TaxID=35608 RepID=A0A2U1M8V5_ARTAN|nr:hypothetical protein CTI12_AA407560 [Artemisia annua]
MNFHLSLPAIMSIFFSFTILAFILVNFNKKRSSNGNNKKPPQAKGAWPIIGHLHLLGGSQLPHKLFSTMADMYGPIFNIKLGVRLALIVSDSEMAKLCFTTNDKDFADRPTTVISQIMGYNYGMIGFAQQLRKIITLELLSQRRVEMLGHIRVSELKASMNDIYKAWVKNEESEKSKMVKVEMKHWFGNLILNVVVRSISGKRFAPNDEEGVRFQAVARRFFELLGVFVVSDFIPIFKGLDIGGYEKTMKITAKEMDTFFEEWLKEHKKEKEMGKKREGNQVVFMDVLISILEDASEEDFPGFDHDTIIKSSCLRPSDEPIDMSESFGLTNMKSTPLEVLLTPRLSPVVLNMNFHLSIPMIISIIFSITVLSFIFKIFNKKRSNSGKHINPPQAKGAWPIIGHLHLFGGSQLPHKVLATLAETYGPIFTIKLGFRLALVVSESEMAKVCLTINDKDFADRPTSVVPQIMGYNYGMFSFAPYGEYWRQVRKIISLELLSPRRVEMLGCIRVSELQASMKDIYESWVKNKEMENSDIVKVDMKHWFGNLILNIVVRSISGKRFAPDDEEGVRFQAVTRRFFELLGVFVVSDLIPIFKGLDIGGYKKAMKITAKEMDTFFEEWLKEHKKEKEMGKKRDGNQLVFMDVLISILEDASEEDFPGFDHDTIIKSSCLHKPNLRTSSVFHTHISHHRKLHIHSYAFSFPRAVLGSTNYFEIIVPSE